MKVCTLLVGLVFGLLEIQAQAAFLYAASDFQSTGYPFGSQTTPMNLSSPGDIVMIVGTGFGDRNVDDGVNEMVYVARPAGGFWTIYRGLYNSSGDHYFGIMSWTDSQIGLEVAPGFGSQIGSFVILRTYSSSNDNNGVSVRGNLVAVVPEPSSVVLVSGVACVALLRRKRG